VTGPAPDWERLKRHIRSCVTGKFELDPNLIHLNVMLKASPPLTVREAIETHRAGLNKDPAGYFFERDADGGPTRSMRETARVAGLAAKYLGLADVLQQRKLSGLDVIAQTTSTTMGLALLANGVTARSGQEVLMSTHDFFTWRDAWRFRSARGDLACREMQLYADPGSARLADEIVDTVAREIRKETRVLAMTWVHSNTGVKVPIGRIGQLVEALNAERAPENRILYCVDGVHGFGVEDADFQDFHCDFFAAGCHKWLFGPRGTGILCGAPESWQHLRETIPSMLPPGSDGARHTPGGVQCFEHVWAVAEAFEFVAGIGKTAIAQYTHGLATRLKKGLASLPGVSVVTPMAAELSSGVVCCDPGLDARQAKKDLLDDGIAAMTATDVDGTHYLRFSPSILNVEADIDKAIDAVSKLA